MATSEPASEHRRRRGRPGPAPLHVDYQITYVDGEQGERLAVLQAQALITVLTWLAEYHRNNATQPQQPNE